MLIRQYRKVFASNDGLDVLEHIFYDLGIFQPCSDTPDDVALKNYGTRLLTILGAGQPEEDTVKTFIKRLISQPYLKTEKK